MLKKNNEPTTPGAHNVFTKGTVLKGDLLAEESLRIDGTIEGNIFCKGKIITGPDSLVRGNIECANLEIEGRLEGNISCSDVIILRSTAVLNGDIKMKIIEIEPGAVFVGSCSILTASGAVSQEAED